MDRMARKVIKYISDLEKQTKQMEKVLNDIESLKDKNRDMYYNGSNGKKSN